MIELFCKRYMAFHYRLYMEMLREANFKEFKLMQLCMLPGAIFQWADIVNLKVNFTFPRLSMIPTLNEVKKNKHQAKDLEEAERGKKELELNNVDSSPNEEMAPSDQLGYIGSTLQEVLLPTKPTSIRRKSIVQALELYIQIQQPQQNKLIKTYIREQSLLNLQSFFVISGKFLEQAIHDEGMSDPRVDQKEEEQDLSNADLPPSQSEEQRLQSPPRSLDPFEPLSYVDDDNKG